MALSRRRQALLARLHRRRTREREGLFLVEGVRGAGDALAAGADVRFALRSDALGRTEAGEALSARLDAAGLEVVDVDDREMAGASDTETPQGVLLVCAEPGWGLDALDGTGATRPRVLVLDAVQDPGNAGTLVRAAAAFGLGGVVALDGTVDPWSPKTVRASAGGVFRTRVVATRWEEAAAWLSSRGLPVLAAEAGGEDVAAVDPGPGWALVVGNEGGGLRDQVLRRADRVVSIPMPGDAESLNAGVAGSILMYALSRTPYDPGGDA